MSATITMNHLVGKFNRIAQSIGPAIFAGADKGMLRMVATAQDNCDPATSTYYKAPYISGDMMRSIGSKVTLSGVIITCILFAGVEYAGRVHEGIGFQEPRPFLFDATLSDGPLLIKDVLAAVDIVFRRECV